VVFNSVRADGGVRGSLPRLRRRDLHVRRVALPAGTGRLRIATGALHGGRYALVVSLPSGQSALRSTVRVLD
jgi:hypothetical protein